jgi:hypothetical protein
VRPAKAEAPKILVLLPKKGAKLRKSKDQRILEHHPKKAMAPLKIAVRATPALLPRKATQLPKKVPETPANLPKKVNARSACRK